MADITIRELRNHGGEVVERAQRGESLTITRDGRPVAKLVPLQREPLALQELRRRRRRLPAIDPDALRADVDAVVDPTL